MPVSYSDHSSGPSTRQASSSEWYDVDPEDSQRDYESLSRDELKAELEARGLDTTGKAKVDLIARLEADDGA